MCACMLYTHDCICHSRMCVDTARGRCWVCGNSTEQRSLRLQTFTLCLWYTHTSLPTTSSQAFTTIHCSRSSERSGAFRWIVSCTVCTCAHVIQYILRKHTHTHTAWTRVLLCLCARSLWGAKSQLHFALSVLYVIPYCLCLHIVCGNSKRAPCDCNRWNVCRSYARMWNAGISLAGH